MKVHSILPGMLYQRGKFIGLQRADKLETLRRCGIDVVVNLIKDVDIDIISSLYKYIHVPVSDNRNAIARLVALSVEVTDLIFDGHVVLTHCNAGRNRSGFLNALVVREILGVSGDVAMEIVRRGRPNALDPSETNGFIEYLRTLVMPND